MKRFSRLLPALAVTAALLCPAALAAGEAPLSDAPNAIAVQLNGENLTFTDAVPQVVDQRTFLPFRTVFEAMGAEVSNVENTITAVRGDTTLTMTLGDTAATVTKSGVETPLTMDVAPYVDPETWRTYVPVRFAAQAFGCSVGWDQNAMTAIIVDTDKLLAQALEGKSFTYLEQLAAFGERYNEGIWDVAMDMEGSATFMGVVIPISANVDSTMADGEKLDMAMNIKLDMSQYFQLISLLSGPELSPEDQAVLDALAQEGIDLEMRYDLAAGKFYMNLDGALPAGSGFDADTWYLMDMNTLYAQTGIDLDWAQLMETSRQVDYAALARTFVGTLTPNTASEEGYGISYGVIKQSVENVIYALSDEGFTKEGSNYSTLIDAGLYKLGLTLTMKQDAVAAYAIEASMLMDMGEARSAFITMTASMDEEDQMTAQINIDGSMDNNGETVTLLGMDFSMSGGYTPGKTAPVAEPPAGAEIVNLAEMGNPALSVKMAE